jgi:hypothetical protein
MQIIHCDKEPFRCKSDFAACRLDDFGRGAKTLSGAVWCATGKQYKKTCDVCGTEHIFTDTTPPPKPPQPNQNPSIFGIHRMNP